MVGAEPETGPGRLHQQCSPPWEEEAGPEQQVSSASQGQEPVTPQPTSSWPQVFPKEPSPSPGGQRSPYLAGRVGAWGGGAIPLGALH